MKRPIEDGLSLLVGAGVGMALMYLLDPDAGGDRREQIQRTAREKLAAASDAASAGFGHLHEAVNSAAQTPAVQMLAARAAEAAKGVYNEFGHHAATAANAANDAQHQAGEAAHGVHSKVAGKLDELRGRATDWAGDLKDSAQSRYGKWLNRTSLQLGRDEDHHYVGQTACALGSLALGAGAVYLLDPDLGHERRAQLVGRATYAVRETGDFFRKTGRHLVTRGRAVARSASDQARDAVSNLRSNSSSSTSGEPSSNQGCPVQGQPTTEATQAPSVR
jgi:gas vesicle protein